MLCFDVFNGDADGICALHQLRLAEPLDSRLVTGVKRDIDLLRRVDAGKGDRVTVLDVSLARNRDALLALLARGARVRYFDHHAAGDVPSHPGLEAHIDESAGVCTSILVDRHLQGRYRAWAVAAAFGDGMPEAAESLAASLGLGAEALSTLRELGENLNYNAYGEREADLLVRPADLYRSVSRYVDPFRMMEQDPVLKHLGDKRREDLGRARTLAPYRASVRADAFLLPDAAWARRVSGVFANELAAAAPERAHAVLTPNFQGGYTVSIRTPRAGALSAAELCRRFGGGGRRGAGGIDHLTRERVEALLHALEGQV
jgi:single-stranded DNA-specific DHH superfamily exonuclease